MANSIVRSPLVKTAIYGKDANWGRIVCAVGYSAVPSLNPTSVNLRFTAINDPSLSLHLFKDGEPFQIDEEIASKILEHEDVEIHVDGHEITSLHDAADYLNQDNAGCHVHLKYRCARRDFRAGGEAQDHWPGVHRHFRP